MRDNKKGQIWVETVIYTLIGLALIGIVLAIATPQINKLKEKRIVEQSIGSLSVFDDTIKEALEDGEENRRVIKEFGLKKGEFYIDGNRESIYLILKDFTKPYSEVGAIINQGSVLVKTESAGKKYNILLYLNYSGIDINLTYTNKDIIKKFTPTNIPYSFSIDNEGLSGDLIEISVSETSSLGGRNLPVNGQNPGCLNECSTNGEKQCSGNGHQTCGNYDSDNCLEWSGITNCAASETCSNGQCTTNEAPECMVNSDCERNDCYRRTCNSGICGNQIPIPFGETDPEKCSDRCDGNGNCNVRYISSCGTLIRDENFIYVLSADIRNPEIDGICLQVEVNNVIIDGRGFKLLSKEGFYQHGTGIKMTDKLNITIKNLTIKDFLGGIDITNSNNITISYNNLSFNGKGLFIGYGDKILINNNFITKNGRGIETNVRNVLLENNYICYNDLSSRTLDLYCTGVVGGNNFIGSPNTISDAQGTLFPTQGSCILPVGTNRDCNAQP